jgi:putative membrane protein
MNNEQQIRSEAEQDADPRIDLAVDRTILALVRTQLAWIRTIITLMTAGLAIDKGFAALHEARMVSGEAWVKNGHFAGLVMTSSGTLLIIIVTINYLMGMKTLNKMKGTKRKLYDPGLILSVLITLIGFLMLYFMFFG